METTVTISASEYRELIVASVKATYAEQIEGLRAEFAEEREKLKAEIKEEHDCNMFWWKKSCEKDEEIKSLKEELAFYKPAEEAAS